MSGRGADVYAPARTAWALKQLLTTSVEQEEHGVRVQGQVSGSGFRVKVKGKGLGLGFRPGI